jgi:hypothetical protein
VTGDRGSHHAYTHVHAQEGLRHALVDLWLLTEWEAFDNHEALLGDLHRSDISEMDEDKEIIEMRKIIGLFRFICTSLNIGAIEECIGQAFQLEMRNIEEINREDIPNFDVEIRFNDEPAADVIV